MFETVAGTNFLLFLMGILILWWFSDMQFRVNELGDNLKRIRELLEEKDCKT